VGFDVPLAHGVGPVRHLRAHCRVCGRRIVFDPTHWIRQHLGGLRLTHFETRLRCICGARQARLEIWSGPAEPGLPDLSIYSFR
jgi:hypothetical protein